MSTPFKMKGSPFQRNFGIGSPMKQDKETASGKISREEQAENDKAYKINSAKKKRDDANQKAANDYYLKTGIEVDKNSSDPEAKRLYNKMAKEYDTPPTREEAEAEGLKVE